MAFSYFLAPGLVVPGEWEVLNVSFQKCSHLIWLWDCHYFRSWSSVWAPLQCVVCIYSCNWSFDWCGKCAHLSFNNIQLAIYLISFIRNDRYMGECLFAILNNKSCWEFNSVQNTFLIHLRINKESKGWNWLKIIILKKNLKK
jgi:hypothetical protein